MTNKRFLGLLGIIALATTACPPGKYTGGGQIRSAAYTSENPVYATFAIVANAKDRDGDGEAEDVKGQMQFVDPYYEDGVSVHGVVTEGGVLPVNVIVNGVPAQSMAYLDGTYTPQPASRGEGGTFHVEIVVFDPQDEVPDFVHIWLRGGVYNGYYRDYTPLLKGNVEFHEQGD